jgi:hypothetical protein
MFQEGARTHVQRFACYFLHEMHYSFIQFDAAEAPDTLGFVPYKAFLFPIRDEGLLHWCRLLPLR